MNDFVELMRIMKKMETSGDFSMLENIPEDQLKGKDELNRITQMFNTIPKAEESICLHPGCSEKAISSHSIQEALLRTIADTNNQVTQVTVDVKFNPKGDITPKAAPIYIRRASTFAGYCNIHDTEVFKPIEDGEINPDNDEQNFVLTLRAIARECFVQHANYQHMKKLSDGLVKMLEKENVVLPYMAYQMYERYLELHHVTNMKLLADHIYKEQSYGEYFDYGYMEIDKELPMFVNAFTVIQATNDGTEYRRNLKKEKPLYLSLTVLKGDGVTRVFYALLKQQKESLRPFLELLNTADAQQKECFLTDTVLRNSDNFYLKTQYWDGIPEDIRSKIVSIFSKTVSNRKAIVEPVNFFEYT